MVWISSKELKIYLIVVACVTLTALFITLIIFLPSYIQYGKMEKQSIDLSVKKADISEYLFPESFKHLWEDKWIPFRSDRDRWTREEIEKYWQDPEEAILNYLENENEKLIYELFKDVP
ncbi:MAG: hypothetical protein L3J12_07170 [Spirochaetales bacterium]|nr:hypothetical protein [Spirochaetales bacterium]